MINLWIELRLESNFPVWGTCSNIAGVLDESIDTPTEFTLKQNYPNPFNPSTRISYSIPVASNVQIEIINMLWQRVAFLVNEPKAAGNYTLQFDASGFSSGIYLYTIQAGDFRQTRKMMLIK